MVDISLEAVDGDSLPKDLYISLRVGEQQKFSKASTGRTYKFSAPVDKRFGKLEIYKRVGVGAISLDSEKIQGTHELAVQVDDDRVESKEVKYRFCLGGAGSMPVSPKAETANAAEKVNVAREYLQQHQLEQRLSEAMQAVLRERPEDPGAFLAQKLQSSAGVIKKVDEPMKTQMLASATSAPPPTPAAAPAAAPAPALRTEVKVELSLPMPANYPLAPPSAADPILPATLMVGPGMCNFSNVGRPAVMIF